MPTTALKVLYIKRLTANEIKTFQGKSKGPQLLPAPAKSFVSPFPPCAVRRPRLLRSRSASARGIHTCPLVLDKSAHHLYFKSLGVRVGGRVG